MVDNPPSARVRVWLSIINPVATMLYYISYPIGPTSSDVQEWIITFNPWLLSMIQG